MRNYIPAAKKDRYDFGSNLREVRSRRFYTQKECAEALGLATSTYSQYENNKREPDFKMLILMAEKLHTSVDFLITGKKDDFYENKIQHLLGTVVYSTEQIHGFFEDGAFCKVTTSYGVITLTMDWYEKLVAKADQKLSAFVREEIRDEVVSQRIRVENLAVEEQITLEAKILCEALHYDYSKVLELKNRLYNYKFPDQIIDLIYALYFYCLDCNEDIESLSDKVLKIDWSMGKLEDIPDVVDEDYVFDEYYYKAQKIFKDMMSRVGERNHIAELYLMKHWGVTQDKMVDLDEYEEPFKLLRKAFLNFHLLQLGQHGFEDMEEMLDGIIDDIYFF